VGVIGDGDGIANDVCGWGLGAWAVTSVEL